MTTQETPLVRIHLRYPDEATFIQRFSPNVTRGGIFLSSRNPRPVGEVIRFEVAMLQGAPLLWGTGRVTWIREFNPAEPHRAHGMGVQFLQLGPACKPVLERLLERKNMPLSFTPASGVPIVPLPVPSSPEPGDAQFDGDPSTWIDDQAMRNAIDRARVMASRTDDVEALRAHGPSDPVTLEKALMDLPRILGPRR